MAVNATGEAILHHNVVALVCNPKFIISAIPYLKHKQYYKLRASTGELNMPTVNQRFYLHRLLCQFTD